VPVAGDLSCAELETYEPANVRAPRCLFTRPSPVCNVHCLSSDHVVPCGQRGGRERDGSRSGESPGISMHLAVSWMFGLWYNLLESPWARFSFSVHRPLEALTFRVCTATPTQIIGQVVRAQFLLQRPGFNSQNWTCRKHSLPQYLMLWVGYWWQITLYFVRNVVRHVEGVKKFSVSCVCIGSGRVLLTHQSATCASPLTI